MQMSETDPLSAAKRLEPLVTALRSRLDRGRRLPDELVQAIGDAGLFGMWLPCALGGPERPPRVFMEVIEELSRQDGSVGWCTAIAAGHGRFAGAMPRHSASEIFGSGRTVLAGTLNPVGKAIAVRGGYRVTGRWAYGSVIDHAQWVYGNCVIHDEDGSCRSWGRARAAPVPFPTCGRGGDRHMACQRAARHRQPRFRGDGSVRARGQHRSVAGFHASADAARADLRGPHVADLLKHPRSHPAGDRTFRDRGAGCARRRQDAMGSPAMLRERPLIQADVARAEALVRAGRALLFDEVEAMWQDVLAGRTVTLRRRALVRLAACESGRYAIQAVDLVHGAGGGTSIREDNRIERCWRDAHAAAQHFSVSEHGNLEPVGRVLLGLEPGTVRF